MSIFKIGEALISVRVHISDVLSIYEKIRIKKYDNMKIISFDNIK